MFQSKSHATSVPWCRNNPEFFLPKAPYMLEILQFTYLLQWLSFIHQLRGAEPNPIEVRPKHFRNFNQGNWSLFYSWWCALIKQYRAMMISCTNCVSAWLFKNFGCVFKLIVQRNASAEIWWKKLYFSHFSFCRFSRQLSWSYIHNFWKVHSHNSKRIICQ